MSIRVEPDKRLLSHRLRGFDSIESSLVGLEAALAANVRHVEFDVRVSRDGCLVAYHDPALRDDRGKIRFIDELSLEELRRQSALRHLATLDEMCASFAASGNTSALMHVDVKVYGYEKQIVASITRHGIISRVVFVSWIPAVLEALHQLVPSAPLCFSHLSLTRFPTLFELARGGRGPRVLGWLATAAGSTNARVGHDLSSVRLVFAENGIIPVEPPVGADTTRCNFGYVVKSRLEGRMMELLKRTNGYVCLPVRLASRSLVAEYQGDGIAVAVFSAKSADATTKVIAKLSPDLVYVDVKEPFQIE